MESFFVVFDKFLSKLNRGQPLIGFESDEIINIRSHIMQKYSLYVLDSLAENCDAIIRFIS